ncbi:MAG: hypothetical protein ABI442_14135 [Gemmatimonadaceae bacterium]
MTRRIFGPKPKLLALATAILAIGGLACGTFTGVPASLPTIADSGAVYAINGAPPGAPTSLHLFSGSLLAADATFTFDVAFDIDSAGAVTVLPQRAVASGLAPTHTVGLQTTTGTYDAVLSAPKNGYRADTAMVLNVNQVLLIQSSDANACGVSLTGSTIYGKVVVLMVDKVTRRLQIQFTSDPNCGFTSFASGLPKD